jgi:hypothetical protein
MPARIRDHASVEHIRRADAFAIRAPLQRMDAESHTLFAACHEWLEIEGMQRRGAGTRVHLAFDPGDAEIRERRPLPPTQDW